MKLQYWRLLAAVCALSALHAESEATLKQAVLLNRVRAHMNNALTTLPNYTCLETIERSRRRPKSKRFDLIDTVRLEVALVNGKELFSWPGERKFDDRQISDIVTGGAIGNGNFALHAKAIFQSSNARFDFLGERIRDGRKTLRWDYDVPQFQSGYRLRVGEASGIVGFRGSFWVDPDTLDLIRLEVEATQIPPHIPILEAKDAMEYSRVKIGEQDFLLPKGSELRMVGMDDSESVNRTTFTGCRQYTGESTLIFTDPAEPNEQENPQAPTLLDVPPGVGFEAELETPIAAGSSAVGDPVTFRVRKDTKRKGTVVLPAGALLHGRISLLRKRNLGPGYVMGMTFHEVEHGNARGPIRLKIERAGINGVTLAEDELKVGNRRAVVQAEAAPSGSLFLQSGSFKLPRGLRMYWRTQPTTEEDKQ